MVKFTVLPTADKGVPEETSVASDQLLIRESGNWIEQKHQCLLYYAKIFNEGMKKKWSNRCYLEFFSGPGKCLIRGTRKELPGSALAAMDLDFTRFIFIEKSLPIAEALKQRLEQHTKASKAEIWVADCNEAMDHVQIPGNALTLAFIDPTKIDHCPFKLIQKARKKSMHIDLLINIPMGMDVKRNIQHYFNQKGPTAHLSRYLNTENWRNFNQNNPAEFSRQVIAEFEKGLDTLKWGYVGKMQQILSDRNLLLYYLFFASAHPTGQKFWDDTVRYCNAPELNLI